MCTLSSRTDLQTWEQAQGQGVKMHDALETGANYYAALETGCT